MEIITEATRTNLSQKEFEDIHAHVALMVDSDEYINKSGVLVDRHIMNRSVSLLDSSARIGGSPREKIPVVSATVQLDQGNYDARAYKYSGVLNSEVRVVRGKGEYTATISNPRAAILVASLAAKAINRISGLD